MANRSARWGAARLLAPLVRGRGWGAAAHSARPEVEAGPTGAVSIPDLLGLLRRAGTLVYGSTWFEDDWNAWTAIAVDESANDRDHEIAVHRHHDRRGRHQRQRNPGDGEGTGICPDSRRCRST